MFKRGKEEEEEEEEGIEGGGWEKHRALVQPPVVLGRGIIFFSSKFGTVSDFAIFFQAKKMRFIRVCQKKKEHACSDVFAHKD